MRSRLAFVFSVVVFVSFAGGAWVGCDSSRICATSTDCAGSEVCLPTAAGTDPATPAGAASYCGHLDDKCPTGLRWSDSAGDELASKCVSFAESPDASADGAAADAPDARDVAVDTNTCGPDGRECHATTDPCKRPGRCADGACGPITDAPDGTKCASASNACRTDRVCKGGVCQPEGTRPDGYNYDGGNYLARCCGGAPTSINTPGNCGACGIRCASGACINAGATNAQQWWCRCSANSECFSNCCANGSPPVCSPSTCGNTAKCTGCPGGASCDSQHQPHYSCHY